jgi:peptidoglycan hydrolase CwlO-like protein
VIEINELKKKNTIWDRLFIYKVYAMRGYTSLVGWIITIGTFAMVLYGYLIESFPILLVIFPNVFVFMLISIPIGLLFLTFLGRWDWKKGTYPKEGAIAFGNNPEWVNHIEKTERQYNELNNKLSYIVNIIESMQNTINDLIKFSVMEDEN